MMKLYCTKYVNFFLLFLCIFLIAPFSLESNYVGSDTLVTRHCFELFPTSENTTANNYNDNKILGFALMEGGFGLGDSGTITIFDGAFAVESAMYLNGGKLVLLRDMHVDNMTTFTSLGLMVGNGHAVFFSRFLQQIGQSNSSQGFFGNINMTFDSDVLLDAALTFSGTCSIDGHGNHLKFSDNGSITVAAGSNLAIRNISLLNVSGTQITCADDNGFLSFENVVMQLDGVYTFSQGYFIVEDMFEIKGNGSPFLYLTDKVSTVSLFSTFMLDYGTTFSYAPSSNANNLLQLLDTTALFKLSSGSLYVSPAGLALTKGKFMVDGNASITNTASSSAQGISFGDGTSAANNTPITLLPAAVLNLLSGFLVYNNI